MAPSPPSDVGGPVGLSTDRRALIEERVLTGKAVHELNNIVSVLAFGQVALDEELRQTQSDPMLLDVLDGQRESIGRLQRVVGLLGALVRERSASLREMVDLVPILEAIASASGGAAAFPAHPSRARVRVPPDELRLMVEDLVRSAGPGSAPVELRLSLERPTTRFRQGQPDAVLRLVRPGAHFDPNRLRRDLDGLFKGGADARSGRVGLAVASALAQLHQAQLSPGAPPDSDGGGDPPGTWVVLRLPCADEPPPG